MGKKRSGIRALAGLLLAAMTACGSEPEVEPGTRDRAAVHDTAADSLAGDAPPPAGAAESAGLHALGQEPGWLVDIVPGGEMRVLAQYGTDTITAPAPIPTSSPDGATVYRATTAEHTVVLTVTDEPCRDAMSGRPFPMTVTLELDGEVFRGCGRRGGGE